MVDPVGRRLYPNPFWALDDEPQSNANEASKAAEPEVISLYYQSSISSLAPPAPTPAKSEAAVSATQVKKPWYSKTKDWLWNLFGINKKSPTDISEDSSIGDPIDNGAPVLSSPEAREQKRLSQTLAELNRELVYRLKDISEFEEEMRKSNSNKLDKLIFMQLIYSSLHQKNLKEEGSIASQKFILDLHAKNKELQKSYYSLLEDISNRAKTTKILHWTGIGLTAGVVGAIAVTFATGGAAALVGSAALSMMTLAKGGTTLSEGIVKYKNDLKTGELFIVSQDSKANSKLTDDELANLQSNDEDIGNLLKTIRHHLDNQSKAERANFNT